MFDFLKNIFGGNSLYTSLEADEFKNAIRETPKSMIIDVRSRNEFDDEKIPHSMNIDIMNPNFNNKLAKFDKDKTYFVYCQKGGRSARACKRMVKLGFEKVYNLKGGINAYTGRTV
ncbi:rhodanese-like domain-containing protein [Chondrinema litorale]|uniref:rhodanese-like domain-containing protein n=1 Tax=Chondrinema litorale TaxID=2994555 RepID=UPI002542AE88|nr:rhodanese-like domain-containing protein [Chondrinema litorale]UZR96008.1 rhodanese-like domain-containing protein [Chondrinema litorale]